MPCGPQQLGTVCEPFWGMHEMNVGEGVRHSVWKGGELWAMASVELSKGWQQ